MKQKLLNSIRLRVWMLVAVLCTMFAGQAWGDTTYKLTKVTSVSAGNKYVFEQNSHVLNNTVSGSALQTTGTYSTTGLTGTESYIWELETATGGFYLKNVSLKSNQYLNNASGKTNMSLGSKNSIWTIAFTDDVALISNKSNSNRYLGDSGDTTPENTYKAYAASNLPGKYPHDFTVYLVEEESTPANISIETSDVNLNIGETNTRTATSLTDGATISYSSNATGVATVNPSTGEVTAVSEGSATITATASAEGYSDATASYTVNVSDPRAQVNISTFTATNTTLIVGGSPSSTATSVTNNQLGWTAAYTYSSDDTDVATVNSSGVITAVGKGTATITCSLNVNPSDKNYRAGTTTSKSIEITVNNPSHTATFSVNSNPLLSSSDSFEEGEDVVFPSDPSAIDGKVFQGWVTEAIVGTQVAAPSFVSSPKMGKSDVTYYAVFADKITGVEGDASMTITNSTQNIPGSYSDSDCSLNGVTFRVEQIYNNNGKLQWKASAGTLYNKGTLSKIQSVVLTYDAADSKKNITLKIGDEANPSSGTSITPSISDNVYTFDCSSYNKDYFVLTNGTNAGYVTSIVINYKAVAPDTYENYCTTISNLPLAVVTLSTENITMTWGESGKTLTATAAIDDEPLDEPITFTPSSPNLTIDGSGNISCDVPGDYTITASVAETLAHQAGQAVCNVTVNKKDIELAFKNETVNMMLSVGEYTQTATATPNAYDGNITYEITSSTSADAIIDEGTGEILFENTGIIVVTATAEEIALYNGNTATYTLYVKTEPELSISDQSVNYGEDFELDASGLSCGDITLTPTSDAIATAAGLVLTPKAVGSTVVTVDAAANDTYVAGSTTFTLTVNAPAGKTTIKQDAVFTETFNKSTGGAGNVGGNDGTWNGSAGSGSLKTDNDGWTYGTGDSKGGGDRCLKTGSSGKKGEAVTPSIAVTNGMSYYLTFKAAPWDTESSTMTVAVTGGTINSKSSVTSSTMTTKKWNVYEYTIVATSTSLSLDFTASNNRFFLDEVKVTKDGSESVKLNGSGYATFCSLYPLDFTDYATAGYSAWEVTDIAKSAEVYTVTFNHLTGTIMGGQGILLKGTAGETVTINSCNSDNTLDYNLLIGTTAPTYAPTDTYFGLSGNNFVKVNAGVVPAGKALLDANDIPDFGSVKSFIFVFNDDATGITETRTATREEVEAIFNLGGQRMSKMQRGLNIVNGKKVLVK